MDLMPLYCKFLGKERNKKGTEKGIVERELILRVWLFKLEEGG